MMYGTRIVRTVEAGPGSTITDAIDFTINLAKIDRTTAYALMFNDVYLRVNPEASASALLRAYHDHFGVRG